MESDLTITVVGFVIELTKNKVDDILEPVIKKLHRIPDKDDATTPGKIKFGKLEKHLKDHGTYRYAPTSFSFSLRLDVKDLSD